MKVAYLIDQESLGGGCEYIARKSAVARLAGGDCRTFYSARGECRPAVLDAWGAEEIVVNHLKALLQLLGNPFRRPKGRVTFVVHGLHLRQFDFLPKTPLNRLKRGLRRSLERWLYRRCDRVIALTESDRTDILRLYGRGLNVVVEPNTLEGWVPHLADGLPPGVTGDFAYVCIGRFDFPKGQDCWIRQLANGKSKMENGGGRTLFIGDGPRLADCRALAAKLGVADRCVFAGAIPEAERYLKCAPVVVSPSRWEGMPYLMMKARALGCRILATDCPGNRDVLAGYAKWEVASF